MYPLWKYLAFMLAALALLVGSAVALADTPPKPVDVALTVATLTNGDIQFTAVTLKEGSSFIDSWSGATRQTTVLNSDGYYVSTAIIPYASPCSGSSVNFNVTYSITMTAGESSEKWQGSATTNLTVSCVSGSSTKTQGDF